MAIPIYKIQYFFWGILNSKSTESSFEDLPEGCHKLAIATCGDKNPILVLESSERISSVYESVGIKQVIHDYIQQAPIDKKYSELVQNLLIDAFNNAGDEAYCEKNIRHFITDPEDLVSQYSPCIFTFSDIAPNFEGAFFNAEFFEIKYEADKLFSFYDLYGRLDQHRSCVYGISI
jgi:hypothetical protein